MDILIAAGSAAFKGWVVGGRCVSAGLLSAADAGLVAVSCWLAAVAWSPGVKVGLAGFRLGVGGIVESAVASGDSAWQPARTRVNTKQVAKHKLRINYEFTV